MNFIRAAHFFAAALALSTPLGLTFAADKGTPKATAPSAPIGRVAATGAGATRLHGKSQYPLRANDSVFEGDIITTGAEPVTILLHEGSIAAAIRLHALTSARLEAAKGHGIQAELRRGMLLSDVHNPDKRAKPFQVRTRTAVMGVRGTIFFVKETPGQPLFLCTCHGEVGVTAGHGTASHEELLKSTHHDHPVTIAEGGGPLAGRMTPAPKGEDHSDAEAGDLEKLLEAQ